jgi:hypothetical protein
VFGAVPGTSPSAVVTPASGRSYDAFGDARAASTFSYMSGSVDYTFLTVSRRDHFRAHAGTSVDRGRLHAYLTDNPSEAVLLEWVLRADSAPICTLRPDPRFARETYAMLVELLGDGGLEHGTQRISVPGTVTGSVTLLDGAVVHAVDPVQAGVFRWPGTIAPPTLEVAGPIETTVARSIDEQVSAFQDRVAFETRNEGVRSSDRALNFAVTELLRLLMTPQGIRTMRARIGAEQDDAPAPETQSPVAAATVFVRRDGGLALANADVRPSPVCRQDSHPECWDVALVFFDPAAPVANAKAIVRSTVDVSTALPVVLREPQIQLMY